MYDFAYDPPRRLLTANLAGFWSVALVEAYSRDVLAEARRIRAGTPDWRMLARGQEMAVQPPEVGMAFQAFTTRLVDLCPGRIAITASTMLNKLQARRSLMHERICVFLSEADALEWLFEEAPAGAVSGAPAF